MIPVLKNNRKLKIAPAIPTGDPIMLEKNPDIFPSVAYKTFKILSI